MRPNLKKKIQNSTHHALKQIFPIFVFISDLIGVIVYISSTLQVSVHMQKHYFHLDAINFAENKSEYISCSCDIMSHILKTEAYTWI